MKMAKASKEEWEKVMAFANTLEEMRDDPCTTNEQLGALARNAPPLFRVVFGYQVIVDNACDPNSDTLDWRPEIAEAIAYAKRCVEEKT